MKMHVTLALLAILCCVFSAVGDEKTGTPPAEELETKLLKGMAFGNSAAIDAVAAEGEKLPVDIRRELKFRVRSGAIEFRFSGETPADDHVEFIVSNKNRDYESLLVIPDNELPRAKRIWQTLQQLTKSNPPPVVEFRLAFAENGMPRAEDLRNVFHRISFEKQPDYFVRELEWENDGLRISESPLDPAISPATRQKAELILVIRRPK